jgi:hypothetical protein
MSDDRFFERLRHDAAPLRYEADDVAIARMAARIRGRVAEPPPGVAQWLAAWFRPLAATLTAVAIAASVGLAVWDVPAAQPAESFGVEIEVSMAGETYRVGQ